MTTFRAELQLDGTTATGITVPPEILEVLGAGKRPAVRVTINGHTFLTTIGSFKGAAKIPVSSAVRAASGVSAGDLLEIELDVDDAPRVVPVPADLAAALSDDAPSRAYFDGLSPSDQRAYVEWIEQAKKPETRLARVTETAARLADRRPRR